MLTSAKINSETSWRYNALKNIDSGMYGIFLQATFLDLLDCLLFMCSFFHTKYQ